MNKEVREKILEIFDLCIKVNQEKGPTIFQEYTGHANWLTVRIFTDGWEGNQLPSKVFQLYLDGTRESILKANSCLAYLRYLEAIRQEQEKSPCLDTD